VLWVDDSGRKRSFGAIDEGAWLNLAVGVDGNLQLGM